MGIGDSFGRGIDLAGRALNRAVEFAKVRFFPLLSYFIVSYIVMVAGIVLAAAVLLILLLPAGLLENPESVPMWSMALGGAIGILLMVFFTSVSMGTRFCGIRYISTGARQPYISGKMSWKGFLFLLIFGIIYGIILGLVVLPLALGLIGPGGLLAGILLMYAMLFVAIVLMVAVAFATVYVQFEMAAGDAGPIEALRKSWGLVKNNFWETAVFFLVMWAISYVLGLVVTVPIMLLSVGAIIMPLIGIPLLVILSFVADAAIETIIMPAWVYFWKEMKGARRTRGA